MGDPSSLKTDGVKIVGAAGCPVFEVTNDEPETYTYTITFTLMSSSGEALSNSKQIVPSVKPGQSVKRAVDTDTGSDQWPASTGSPARVKIIEVRDVPTTEAPSEAGPCPPSGVRVYADAGDAAMGLRVVGLHLTNCGTRSYRLDGYPQLQLLDERHEPVDGVKILHGGDAIAAGTGADGPPRALVLKPGESAQAGLVWRNTTLAGAGDPVSVPYVRVLAKTGAAAVMVAPDLDLGTTGKLGIGPWQKAAKSPSP